MFHHSQNTKLAGRIRMRRGILTMETLCACGLILATLGLLAATLFGLGSMRRQLLHQTIAEQTLANTVEWIASIPPEQVEEQLAKLEMPAWSSQQLPGAELTASFTTCLLYTSPSPRDQRGSRMPSSA